MGSSSPQAAHSPQAGILQLHLDLGRSKIIDSVNHRRNSHQAFPASALPDAAFPTALQNPFVLCFRLDSLPEN